VGTNHDDTISNPKTRESVTIRGDGLALAAIRVLDGWAGILSRHEVED